MAVAEMVGRYSHIPKAHSAWTLSSPIEQGRKFYDLCGLDCVVSWCKARQKLVAVKPTGPPLPVGLLPLQVDNPFPVAAFDAFWKAYPRKVAKPNARKAFAKVLANGVTIDTLLAAIDRQKRSQQWQKDSGQFIPHPATWLNQERWTDAVDAMPVKSCIQGGIVPQHSNGNF